MKNQNAQRAESLDAVTAREAQKAPSIGRQLSYLVPIWGDKRIIRDVGIALPGRANTAKRLYVRFLSIWLKYAAYVAVPHIVEYLQN